MKTKVHILILFVFLFVSCEEKYEFVPDSSESFIVIEGIITNEYKRQELKITYSAKDVNTEPEGIADAKVYVSDGQTAYDFSPVTDTAGLYRSDTPFAATIDKTYSLWVEKDGKILTARDQPIPVNIPDSIKWTFVPEKNLYRISYVADVFDPFESAMYIIDLDWSQVGGYQNLLYDSTHARVYFFTLQTVDVNELFQPDKEIVYFPKGTQITEKKYSLTPFFAMYIRALLIETQWSGSLFDTEHWNLPTNIKGGAIGFFTASSVVKKTYTVN